MKMESQKKYFLLSAFLLILLAVMFTQHYFSEHYLPYRQVRPIVEKLSSNEMRIVQRGALHIRGLDYANWNEGGVLVGIPGHVPLSGKAAEIIEKKILEILPTIDDQYTLGFIFSSIPSAVVKS
jgi:hypothetical protein